MNQYQFDQILRRTSRRFGKIRMGKEDPYTPYFLPIESNLLKVNRAHPECTSLRLLEAIKLALYEVEDRLEDRHSDTSSFENPENLLLKHAILMAFDPCTNEDIRRVVGDGPLNRDILLQIYETPAKVLVRLHDSVITQMEMNGSDGYFVFLRGFLGFRVPHDDKMNFVCSIGTSL